MHQENPGSQEKESGQETIETQDKRLGSALGQGSCQEEVTIQLSLEGASKAEGSSAQLRARTRERLYPGPHASVCQTLSLGSGSGAPHLMILSSPSLLPQDGSSYVPDYSLLWAQVDRSTMLLCTPATVHTGLSSVCKRMNGRMWDQWQVGRGWESWSAGTRNSKEEHGQ